ncbi:MAG: response regulator transcription factor [Elusimicrobia bacterium]|nr:response regulator transcription factor [Elusimicrobiota bacterium]
MNVAVAAEDARLRERLGALLSEQGYRVQPVASLAQVLAVLRAARPHLLVIAHESGDGPVGAALRRLREAPELRSLPVLCIDPKASTAEGVALLDAGADDVIHRPFQPPIFLARVRTLLRRVVWSGEAPEETVTSLNIGPLELRLVSRQAVVAGRAIELTRLEFDLLAHLLKHPERAFKREELLAAVWNYPAGVETRTLDKHIESLRRKLGVAGALIETVHGVGYRFASAA